MRNLIPLLIVAMMAATTQAQNWAFTALGGSDSSAAFGIGKVNAENRTEFGLSALTSDEEPGGLRSAFGPYGAYQAPVPGIDAGDAMSFLGAAVHLDTDSRDLLYTGFAGLILNPKSQASPVVVYRYNWSDSAAGALPVDRSTVFMGLRLRF
jgi:hypothetical protein